MADVLYLLPSEKARAMARGDLIERDGKLYWGSTEIQERSKIKTGEYRNVPIYKVDSLNEA